MKIFYYDIAVSLPLRQCFTYSSELKITKGTRVSVPFGKRKIVGVVIKNIQKPDFLKKAGAIKKIIAVLDEYPLFDKPIFDSILWSSDYYHHPIGEVFNTFIPTELRKINNKKIEALREFTEYSVNEDDKKFDLTKDQEKAVKALSKSKGFSPTLLYGVTGSGKTEVYLRVAETFIKNNKSVLVLVPEINLTPQLLSRFENRFNGEIGIYHSKQTAAKRLKTWLKAKFGSIKIIVGTRSSALVPLDNIGLIIIDEEHDQSFRQSEGFKFSARDLSIKRAQLASIPIILGSATPSLQTLKLVKENKFTRVDIPNRVDGNKPPKLIALDINNSPLIGGVAKETIEAMQSTIDRGEQVLVFINRRGFAPLYQCGSCGWVADCKSCDTNLVFHQARNRLICHRCESAYSVNSSCPACKSNDFNMYGAGTERVEEVLKSNFVKTPIIRVDHDSTKKVGAMEAIVKKIHSSDAAILVGTQMLAKGHDFPKVTLSVILNADNGLISPEINALEKISQLLIQVSGRAGRNNNLAKVIIQTRYPDDINLNKIKTGDYMKFASQCLSNNEQMNLPPFTTLCLLRCSSPTQKSNVDFLEKAVLILSNRTDINVIGPLPSLVSKSKGNYRHQVYIHAPKKTFLNKVLKFLTTEFEKWPESNKVKWSFDIDPIDLS